MTDIEKPITTEPSDDELLAMYGAAWASGTVADGLRAVFRAGVATHPKQQTDELSWGQLARIVRQSIADTPPAYRGDANLLVNKLRERFEIRERGVATHNTVSREQIADALAGQIRGVSVDEMSDAADAVLALLVPTSKENDGYLTDQEAARKARSDWEARAAVSTSKENNHD